MQALGLIETKGLVAAVDSADAMLKAAEVTLIEKTYVGGGLVSIIVSGDVAAVKAAVEAGVAAVTQMNKELLVSQHVIPRPNQELHHLIRLVKPNDNIQQQKFEPKKEVEERQIPLLEIDVEEVNKHTIDSLALQNSLAEILEFLATLKVTKLRKLAREYPNIGIAGRLISKANKKMLLEKFHQYYSAKHKRKNN